MPSFVKAATLALLLGVAAAPALAAGTSDSGGSTSSSSSSGYDKAVSLIERNRFADAVPLLQDVVKQQPRNADAWNYLGFALRKLNRTDEAFAAYNEALLIDPKHDGANEYLGELYLMVGDLEKAEGQLTVLDANCSFNCTEYKQLKTAIEAYKKRQGS